MSDADLGQHRPSTPDGETLKPSECDDVRSKGSTATGGEQAEKSNASPEQPTRQESASPDSKCSICLGELTNKSFTDVCFHTFCFECLREWAKVRAICPLCKQAFTSIIHSVRSFSDYEQTPIPSAANRAAAAAEEQRRFRYEIDCVVML
jgi:hypothetical protein